MIRQDPTSGFSAAVISGKPRLSKNFKTSVAIARYGNSRAVGRAEMLSRVRHNPKNPNREQQQIKMTKSEVSSPHDPVSHGAANRTHEQRHHMSEDQPPTTGKIRSTT